MKNINTSNISFELNCGYYLYIFFQENTNSCFWSKTVNKSLIELKKLNKIYQDNICCIHRLSNLAYNKNICLKNIPLVIKFG